ncbi:hypothetical protein J4Q44_G00219370 [Coregonus suidteri]|uniref:Uncharacterized protein n=1 Tax=Coregonus suidteri TaxID=861788 RepID=A0AAN8LR98_9TELE
MHIQYAFTGCSSVTRSHHAIRRLRLRHAHTVRIHRLQLRHSVASCHCCERSQAALYLWRHSDALEWCPRVVP